MEPRRREDGVHLAGEAGGLMTLISTRRKWWTRLMAHAKAKTSVYALSSIGPPSRHPRRRDTFWSTRSRAWYRLDDVAGPRLR
jgi:hypothetical protein